ncbi:molybdate ABC transporter substrate-binding protein [Thiomicrorhabdus arctica]|uniref:molybdate ABC transporter substrate-binding protein n=1 Tax=Thiomicrorhabdus arctica TaxID=131540 RepID=UPI00037BB30B|nr:substrate-binding domain-containing protein [Thiomicrorhabdus arctica]
MNTIMKKMGIASALTAGLILAGPTMAEDAGQGHDYRTFHANDKIDYGKIEDSYNSDLTIYVAGNQFMVMEELMKDFQKKNPDIKKIYLETIPPGQILKGQILKQGEINGQKTAQNPDLFASVNLGHLKKLKAKGVMDDYLIYTHNKLELMIAKGNPKNIKGVEDLTRKDLVKSFPNPLTEGIFKFYGSRMLKDLGMYQELTNDQKCKGCWAVKDETYFTNRHHRETPHRIENGQADVGIVWTTEVKHGKSQGRAIDGIEIPAKYNMGSKVGYAIGVLKTGKNPYNALRYMTYISSDDAQNIYASYGFVKASLQDLKLKSIPTK